jgi:hypothetical protein
MTEADLFDLIDPVLAELGSKSEDGEEFREPALDILRYYRKPVRLHWFPVLGQALSIVAVVRQPFDLAGTAEGHRAMLIRLSLAANGRFPFAPWRAAGERAVALAMTVIQLTPEPIGPEDDATLQAAFEKIPKRRAVPLGILRVNLGQEAMAFAISGGPGNLFPEAVALADALTPRLRRYVPLIEFE